ncbi:MAG TPA: hypothetical protein DCE42_03010, partial [Myxococcales bacterium]|nr:hypothetical protein [Myxococcales bacterium]
QEQKKTFDVQVDRHKRIALQKRLLQVTHITTQSTLLVCFLLSTGLCLYPRDAQANQWDARRRKCRKLFKKNQYLRAVSCFRSLYRKSKQPQDLLNIAQSYRIAARNQISPLHALTMRKRAIRLLRRYQWLVRKKPIESNFARQMRRRLRRKVLRTQRIGYAPLLVSSSPSNASYILRNEKLVLRGVTPLYQDVPPGIYTLTITHKGYHPYKVRLIMNSDVPLSLHYKMIPLSEAPPRSNTATNQAGSVNTNLVDAQNKRIPPKPQAPPTVPLALIGGSTALLATGVVVLSLAAVNTNTIKNSQDANTASQAYNDLSVQLPVGIVLVSVGVVGNVVAGVLLLSPPK